MKIIKRFLLVFLSLLICFSTSFAALAMPSVSDLDSEGSALESSNVPICEATYHVSSTKITLVNTSDNTGIMPMSTVSGYNQSGITTTRFTLSIPCNGSGKGGMGITIQASCSYGDYSIRYHGYAYEGTGTSITGTMLTNQTVKHDRNLLQVDLKKYCIEFECNSNTPDYFVKVWIYG